jgi:hypothetical protein
VFSLCQFGQVGASSIHTVYCVMENKSSVTGEARRRVLQVRRGSGEKGMNGCLWMSEQEARSEHRRHELWTIHVAERR